MSRSPPPRRAARVERIPAERRGLILDHLRRNGAASIQELADSLGASHSTIRRDLEALAAEGYLERSHGGAALPAAGRSTFEPDAAIAAQIAHREKQAIGRFAAGLLEPGQSVIFDSSSTVLAAARAVLARGIPLTAVTPDLAIATVLARAPAIRVVVPGGTVRPGSLTLTGDPGETFLAGLHADVALLGTHAITGTTLTETSLDVARIKRGIIGAARRVIVLADGSKLGPPAFCTICDATALGGLVTDGSADPAALAALRDAGITVHVAPPDPG